MIHSFKHRIDQSSDVHLSVFSSFEFITSIHKKNSPAKINLEIPRQELKTLFLEHNWSSLCRIYWYFILRALFCGQSFWRLNLYDNFIIDLKWYELTVPAIRNTKSLWQYTDQQQIYFQLSHFSGWVSSNILWASASRLRYYCSNWSGTFERYQTKMCINWKDLLFLKLKWNKNEFVRKSTN